MNDTELARRVQQIELLFDLHSAGMATKAIAVIAPRLRRVREELERRAAHEGLMRAKLKIQG